MTNILLSLDLILLVNSYNVLLLCLAEISFFLNIIDLTLLIISALSFLNVYIIILRESFHVHFFRLHVRLLISYMK